MIWKFFQNLRKKPAAPSLKKRRVVEPDTSRLVTDVSTMGAFGVPLPIDCGSSSPNLVVESPSICTGNSDSDHGSCDVN